MSPPLVSVIVPLYNRETYVEECLNSILSTNYNNLEIIVIDDGSVDEGPLKVQALIDRGFTNIHLLSHPEGVNKGVSASRNMGLEYCSGNYVTFLDSDDLMNPWRFDRAVDVLKKYPTVDAVVEADELFGEENEVVERLVETEGSVEDCVEGRLQFDLPGIPATGSFLFRKSIFSQTGLFDERKHIGEDFDLWYRVYAVGLIVPDNRSRPVCRYRRHEGNTVVVDAQQVHLNGFAELYKWARSKKCDAHKCAYLKCRYVGYFFDYFHKARLCKDRPREMDLLVRSMLKLPSFLVNARYLKCVAVFIRDILSDCLKKEPHAL